MKKYRRFLRKGMLVTMERFITKDNIDFFCSTNKKHIVGGINKIAVEFPGFDGNSCFGGNYNFKENDTEFAKKLGVRGILLVYVFIGPWSWMRDVSVRTVDDIIDSIMEKYVGNTSVPIVLAGGSMGGYGALMYAVRSSYKIEACAVSCPVCDLADLATIEKYHFFCASIFAAFGDCEGEFFETAKKHSPLYTVSDMPNVPYFMIICDNDTVIPPAQNSLPFLHKMREFGFQIEDFVIHGNEHCEHTEEAVDRAVDFICEKREKIKA